MATKSVYALDRAFGLLDLIVRDNGRSNIAALAKQADLPLATAHRFLASFCARRFVFKVGRGRYIAGLGLVRLCGWASLAPLLIKASRNRLIELSRQTKMTAHLGVLDGDMVTYLVKADPDETGLFTQENSQLEAYCSAIGKVLLAGFDEEALENYLANGPFVAITPYTIIDVDLLRDAIRQGQHDGYAQDEREFDADLRCISVPVFDSEGQVVAAISLATKQPLLEPRDFLAELRLAADNIGTSL
jgi:IclR family transcriptional regulator, acetate operon repressor